MSDGKSCSSSESRFIIGTGYGKVEDCECAMGEDSVFTGDVIGIFAYDGIGFGVWIEVLVWDIDSGGFWALSFLIGR